MQLDNPITISPGDYPEEHAELVETLGGTLNDFMRQVVDLSRANIGFDNLTSELLKIEITVDSTGKPVSGSTIRVNKNASPQGFQVVSARASSSGVYPTSQPFISFTPKGNFLIEINNITGLQAGQKYQLTVISY